MCSGEYICGGESVNLGECGRVEIRLWRDKCALFMCERGGENVLYGVWRGESAVLTKSDCVVCAYVTLRSPRLERLRSPRLECLISYVGCSMCV